MSEAIEKYVMPVELLKLFHCVVPGECGELVSFNEVNRLACMRGFLVAPESCTELVRDWLLDIATDPNSTFYKAWFDIESRSEVQLAFDQMVHYMSTYGTDFACGNGYVPNNRETEKTIEQENYVIDFSKLTAIPSVTADELKQRCIKMLASGIALSADTVLLVYGYIKAHGGCDISEIRNREARCLIYQDTATTPTDPVEFVRYLVYVATGSAMLVNTKKTCQEIRATSNDEELLEIFKTLGETEYKILATVYFRFKKLFMALRGVDYGDAEKYSVHMAINRISHLAKKLKQPYQPGVLDCIFVPGDRAKLDAVAEALEKTPMFRRLRLLQAVADRLAPRPLQNSVYTIRTGRLFVRKGYAPKRSPESMLWLQSVQGLIIASIANFITKKKKTGFIKVDDNIAVALPTSEKNFVGDYPMGTKLRRYEHNVIGVYWRNEWGTRDFDLSASTMEGTTISWNTTFKSDIPGEDPTKMFHLRHSGDMTNADPEATECIYFGGYANGGIIFNLHQFSGWNKQGRYRMFFAKKDACPLANGDCMVKPEEIIVQLDSTIAAKRTTLAIANHSFVMLIGKATGNDRAPMKNGDTVNMVDSLIMQIGRTISLVAVLKLFGFHPVNADYHGEVDLDLTKMDRDTLIKFFTEPVKEKPKPEEAPVNEESTVVEVKTEAHDAVIPKRNYNVRTKV